VLEQKQDLRLLEHSPDHCVVLWQPIAHRQHHLNLANFIAGRQQLVAQVCRARDVLPGALKRLDKKEDPTFALQVAKRSRPTAAGRAGLSRA